MLSLYLFSLLSLLPVLQRRTLAAGSASGSDDVHHDHVKQVAVIGAGAAGSSAAYHLRKYADEAGIAINITIFEKTGRIGGRTLTVNVYDDPVEPMELGASIFVDVNYIMSGAVKDFGLSTKDPGGDEDGILGIWDGDEFVYTQDSTSWDWVNLARLFWKYGTAPYYTRQLVQQTVGTFLKLYEEPFFPFRSLSTRAYQLDLVKITSLTGRQFLSQNKLDNLFAHHIVQASTRVNYASNLEFIHGLGTMVAMAPEGAKAVEGGNWRIFANMVNASGAVLHLNMATTDISLNADQKYKIKTQVTKKTTTEPGQEGEDEEVLLTSHSTAFDDVIIATPFQYAEINTPDDLIQQPIDAIPYATLHVTLFASPFKFSAAFFKMPPASTVPDSVLTTLGSDEKARPGGAGAGKAGFYSATLQRVVVNPRTRNPEYVYKIFSPEPITAEFLSELLGVEIPGPFPPAIGNVDFNIGDDSLINPISWYHATVFHPYPQKYPRVTFQDPILRDGLYYTSGIESFISTMETSALMGANVARLIVDDYAGIPRAEEEEKEVGQDALNEQQASFGESLGRPLGDGNEL
ncbi:prenylcysteine oxidase [Xylariaceae sp. FL0255]|nr:prenylcysteine oxidase [Xylariaceae sp. FL0255]